jgi:hypothetical protein
MDVNCTCARMLYDKPTRRTYSSILYRTFKISLEQCYSGHSATKSGNWLMCRLEEMVLFAGQPIHTQTNHVNHEILDRFLVVLLSAGMELRISVMEVISATSSNFIILKRLVNQSLLRWWYPCGLQDQNTLHTLLVRVFYYSTYTHSHHRDPYCAQLKPHTSLNFSGVMYTQWRRLCSTARRAHKGQMLNREIRRELVGNMTRLFVGHSSICKRISLNLISHSVSL